MSMVIFQHCSCSYLLHFSPWFHFLFHFCQWPAVSPPATRCQSWVFHTTRLNHICLWVRFEQKGSTLTATHTHTQTTRHLLCSLHLEVATAWGGAGCPPAEWDHLRGAQSEAALQVPATADTDLAYATARVKDGALLKHSAPAVSMLWSHTKVHSHADNFSCITSAVDLNKSGFTF